MTSETFLYFAYGSNMSAPRLLAADRTPSAQWMGAARVAGYRLVFDKVGRDGSGKADCERTGAPTDVVHGALFRIALGDRPALDRAEGLGNGYDAFEIGVDTDSGVASALTYLATRKDAALRPFTWYMHHVLHGARQCGLPSAYIAAIERVTAVRDLDAVRETHELSIYSKR
ncbi:gamma-glutamylcyclotransferase family protein [Variovorax sp. PBL-E5]|uniref:gamma-glutamylcyclotransferase family protein n=1 Tax=Variovorax sp. PBL-E5 TaxID=434014 RepID=UPI001315DF94|nr:gamma-glutamylcyclotransferase family protein [Variovorax sp. PBL-E5]VTU32325.1 putative protein involved in cation transport [Variovorax sp. PBL-E5]